MVEKIEHIWLPKKLIEICVQNDDLEALGTFCRLRVNKSPFVLYEPKEIAKTLNLSLATVYNHINKLKELDLLFIENKHIRFRGANALKKLFGQVIVSVPLSSNKQIQRTYLRSPLIIGKLKQQEKAIIFKENAVQLQKKQHLTKKEYQRLKKVEKSNVNVNSVKKDLTLSNAKFGSLCNRSQSTGKKIQKELNKLGLIKSKRNFEFISKFEINSDIFKSLDLSSKYILSKKGLVYIVLPNIIYYLQ